MTKAPKMPRMIVRTSGIQINGYRLKQVRELLGWTQGELGERLGLRQPAIAELEAGVSFVTDQVAELLASETGFPVVYFSKQTAESEFPLGSHLNHRAKARMSMKSQKSAHRSGEIWWEVAFSMLSAMGRTPPVVVPRACENPIEGAAATRVAMGLSPDRPILNLMRSIESSGAIVLSMSLPDECDAFSCWVNADVRRPVIVLSDGKPGDRQNWNLAHELGHLVLHEAPGGDVRSRESEANKFAAELLLPKSGVKADLRQPLTMGRLAELKLKWRVAMQAIARRAFELGEISDGQYRHIFQKMSPRRVREPVQIAGAKPRVVRQLAEQLYGCPVDHQAMARDHGLTPWMIKRMLDSYAPKDPQPSESVGRVVRLKRKT